MVEFDYWKHIRVNLKRQGQYTVFTDLKRLKIQTKQWMEFNPLHNCRPVVFFITMVIPPEVSSLHGWKCPQYAKNWAGVWITSLPYTGFIGPNFIGGDSLGRRDNWNQQRESAGLLNGPGYPCLNRTIVKRIRAYCIRSCLVEPLDGFVVPKRPPSWTAWMEVGLRIHSSISYAFCR